MLHELKFEAFGAVHELFAPLRFRLDSVTALDGSMRGRVWVDDPENPRSAFLAGSTVYFLAGEPSDRFCREVNHLITEQIFVEDPLGRGRKAVRIVPQPDTWDEAMRDILAGRTPIRARRRSYVYDLANEPPEFPVPDGCEFRAVDSELLADPTIEVHRLAIVPMECSYGSIERFLERCFQCVAILDGRTVAWAPGNNVAGTVCELGISTDPEYRQRGLGVATVAEALRLAKSRGMTEVSWQCGERNPGSIRVAERVGFVLEREYTGYMAVGDEKIHEEVLADWKHGKLVF